MSEEDNLLSNITESQLFEITPRRSVGGAAFKEGTISYEWDVGSLRTMILNESFLRLTVDVETLQQITNVPESGFARPRVIDQVACAFNAPNNLFTNIQFLAGGVQVSSCNTLVPQISAIDVRSKPTRAWIDTLGQTSAVKGGFARRLLELSGSNLGGSLAIANGAVQPFSVPHIGEDLDKMLIDRSNALPNATAQIAAGVVTLTPVVTVPVTANINPAPYIGASIVVSGTRYKILTGTINAADTTLTIQPEGTAAATTDWYFLRRNFARTYSATNSLNIVFKPPIGIWKQNFPMGPGSYQLRLTPTGSVSQCFLESTNSALATTDVNVNISDLRLYVKMPRLRIPDSISDVPFNEYSGQLRAVTSTNGGTFQMTCEPSTRYIYVFLQSTAANSSFINSVSRFTEANNNDLAINYLQVSYSGITLPNTRVGLDITYTTPASLITPVRKQAQYFYEQWCANNGAGSEEGPGNSETFDQWLMNGAIYKFDFSNRDFADKSSDVLIDLGLDSSKIVGGATGLNLGVVFEYSKTIQVTNANGRVVNVKSLSL